MSDSLSSARCMWMRGGTSRGGYFLAADLPDNVVERDRFLLAIMGSPDPRQIDGLGGGDPLTSKVAVIKPSTRDDADVDYLFLQVMVDKALVSDAQNCGNILAGVAPFAIERGLVKALQPETPVRIFMQNTGQVAEACVQTSAGHVIYAGDAAIDGVPGTASPVPLTFKDTAGASCGALLPTGNVVDVIDDIDVTCIDNGMPTVIMRATDLILSGRETREQLEADTNLRQKLESLRLQAGRIMNLGDVTDKTVPKMTLTSAAVDGGAICTRTFIPHRCHASIGVLGAVSVATACLLRGSVAASLAEIPEGSIKTLRIEHPTGQTTVIADTDSAGTVQSAALLRTVRKLFDGVVFAALPRSLPNG